MISFIKNWTLPISILTGIAAYFLYVSAGWLDSTHAAVGRLVAVIQPALIFSMLYLTFLSIGPHDLRLRRWHLWHVMIQLALFGVMAGVLTRVESPTTRLVVECAMLCLLCPTATAAAVVTRRLGGSAADITTYTIIINLAVALTAPALLPVAHPHAGMTFAPAFAMIVAKVFPLLICPLAAAWLTRRYLPRLTARLRSFRDLPFYLWAVALAIAIAVTVKAIVHTRMPAATMAMIVVVTILCCVVQFAAGKLIGRRYGSTVAGGQALGQKNTVFIIWLGYTFLSPATAIAGGLYSVWHNLINSWQLYRHRHDD
ncbi:MAG: hypothetical protein NC336_02555, partial [Clostridium sp.]|nr:hypothetical protein [Clostridium sp.]